MGDSDDDLGAFFEEVSAAEAEAKKELEIADTQTTSEFEYKQSNPVLEQQSQQDQGTSPPNKKQKLVAASAALASATMISAAPVVFQHTSVDAMSGHIFEQYNSSEPLQSSAAGTISRLPPQGDSQANSAFRPPPEAAGESSRSGQDTHASKKRNDKVIKRAAAGKEWIDPTLQEWPENDFRLFVGNLGKEVKNEELFEHFKSRYSSVEMVRIVCDKNNQSKGYGFVSMLDPLQAAKAIREMNDSFLGARPLKVKRSDWKQRDQRIVARKNKKNSKR